MANNSKVKTFISDYSISAHEFDAHRQGLRHIIKNSKLFGYNKSLCGKSKLVVSIFSLTEPIFNFYSSIYKSLCPKCLNKLPEELVEELNFTYIVKKLKS